MRRTLLFLGLVLSSGCARNRSIFPPDSAAHTAVGAPARFTFDRGGIESDSVAVMKCLTPLWDLRGQRTQLTLVRSVNGRVGDYEVSPPRYGIKPDELIRVNCVSGAVVGIVPR